MTGVGEIPPGTEFPAGATLYVESYAAHAATVSPPDDAPPALGIPVVLLDVSGLAGGDAGDVPAFARLILERQVAVDLAAAIDNSIRILDALGRPRS